MKWLDIKDCIIREFAILTIDFVYMFAKKFAKDELKNDRFYKFRTPTHRVRIVSLPNDSFLLVRPKGFFKLWTSIERENIPSIMAEEVFEESCTPKRRKQLAKKIIGLKAFW